jgi:tetratricopeptide (TPR) repeat protein
VKAFLSHSSKDKFFVREVADILGLAQCELDELTFDITLNVDAIHTALTRSDLFVLFLSKNSITSKFIEEEQRVVRELRGRGLIRKILIFPLDNTSYKALPDWLQDVNVCNRISSSKACARRIQIHLLDIAAEDSLLETILIERPEPEKQLRKALAAPTGSAPIVIHVVAYEGLGRRTFISKSLSRLYPTVIGSFPSIPVAQNQGFDDIYRNLYGIHKSGTIRQITDDFMNFTQMADERKAVEISNMIIEIADSNEMTLFVDDGGGVLDDSGAYHDHIRSILDALPWRPRPLLGIIQTRMMPYPLRSQSLKSFYVRIPEFTEEESKELLGFMLKQKKIDYSEKELQFLSELVDGHPVNAKFAVEYASEYGLNVMLSDPEDVISWKRRRALDFLKKISFSVNERNILSVLYEYRVIASDMLFAIFEDSQEKTAKAIRRLEEFCCVDRRGDYFHIATPIRDAVGRDARFKRDENWRQEVARKIISMVSDCKDEDNIPVAVLNVAAAASPKTTQSNLILSQLVLPSHLLKIAREHYDKKERLRCIDFARRAYSMKDRLPSEARVEALRLWGLSAVRVAEDELTKVYSELTTIKLRSARRVHHFLKGFHARMRNKVDDAEREFLLSHRYGEDNPSINREIASLFARQGRFKEADSYARKAYKHNPTNAFLIDIMISIIEGRRRMGDQVDLNELSVLHDDLRQYGEGEGLSFFSMREAERLSKSVNSRLEALGFASRAVNNSPNHLPAYLCRANVYMSCGDIPAAEKDLLTIKHLIKSGGSSSDIEEFQVIELEVRIMVEKKSLNEAMHLIESSRLPFRIKNKLSRELAIVISYDPLGLGQELLEWAKSKG